MNRWLMIQAEWATDAEDWSERIEIFRSFGVEGTEQQSDPPKLRTYVSPSIEEERLNGLIQALEASSASVSLGEIEEEDWSETWKEQFKPFAVGKRIWIQPSWDDSGDPGDRLVLIIDPGQAFGTGDHPTTKMCLELMERIPAKERFLDIGCGTGILSVAAAKLGWKEILATDIDEAAIECSEVNAERNSVEFDVRLTSGMPDLPAERYQLIVSNIISATIIRIAPNVAPAIATGGHWIVSGIIAANWPEVQAELERLGLRLVEERHENEWVAATFAK